MKKLIILITCVTTSIFAQVEGPKYSYDDLKPTASQSKVETFVTQFLNNYHFRKFNIDDSLSAKVWNSFIENLDGSKLYFTTADIAGMEKYKYTLDESLVSGDLNAVFEVSNLFRKKYKQRHLFIKEQLGKAFDYNTAEVYNYDRTKGAWADTDDELNKVWKKTLLSQAVGLKLSGATDSSITKTLNKRYDMYDTRMLKWRSEDVFQIFMNAFTEIVDPHTTYMVPSTAAQFNIEMSQSLEGIGATLINEGDFVVIKDIVTGGPLFKSGLANKNDRILAVAQGDDSEYTDIIGWLTDDAVKLIRGKKGTIVRLKLLPSDAPDGSEPKLLRIVREKIKLEESVAKSKVIDFMHDKKDFKLGIIDLPIFYRDFEYARQGGDFQSTTRDVKKFLEEFKVKKVDGVVIDLRNNGGGSLTEAINLTGLFIEDGPVVQRKTSRNKIDVESDVDPEKIYAGPLLILQNRFSASASEIFAGAIQDYKRGLIVGETSYGKGTVQQMIDLDQFLNSPKQANNTKKGEVLNSNMGFDSRERFGQLKLTTEKFYRVSGNSTQLKGVAPDIALPTPFDSEEYGESSQATALPYDEIPEANFVKTNNITEKIVNKIEAKFNARLKNDEDLKDLVKDLEEYKMEREKKEYSLNLEIRKKEKKESDENRKAVRKLNKSIGEVKAGEEDVYLTESQKMLCELIGMQK